MSLQKYEQGLKSVEPNNIYLIKKLANCLLYEFENTKNKHDALKVKERVSQLYTRIRTNIFWARRVADLMNIMNKKIKKMK